MCCVFFVLCSSGCYVCSLWFFYACGLFVIIFECISVFSALRFQFNFDVFGVCFIFIWMFFLHVYGQVSLSTSQSFSC